jgi:DNA-binding transcriptional MocR family regulator
VEDDIFADFVETAPPRLAALDRLERTLYIGSFSKTLSSNVRVGFIAGAPESIDALSRIKLLTTITTSELGENLVYEMLLAGHYRKHVAHLRDRLAIRRARMASELERAGWEVYGPPDAGMFLWARHPAVADSLWTAQGARNEGLLLAAGASFRPLHEASAWMRFNAACSADASVYQVLGRAPELARRAEAAARAPSQPARAAA